MRSIKPFLNTVFHDDALTLLGALPTASVDERLVRLPA